MISHNVFKDTSFTIISPTAGLFANDFDDVGFTLTAFDAVSINGGTVVVNSDGTWSYNPPTGYVGDDSFTYTIIDAGLLTSTATVSPKRYRPGCTLCKSGRLSVLLKTPI